MNLDMSWVFLVAVVEVKVTLRLTVCLGIKYPCGTCDQILFPVGMLLSEICGLVSGGRPLWREDGSAICSVITQWSESLRTRNHILLSSETPPIWRARFPYIYPPGTGWASYTAAVFSYIASEWHRILVTCNLASGYKWRVYLARCVTCKRLLAVSHVFLLWPYQRRWRRYCCA
jgi:hypothetical protein